MGWEDIKSVFWTLLRSLKESETDDNEWLFCAPPTRQKGILTPPSSKGLLQQSSQVGGPEGPMWANQAGYVRAFENGGGRPQGCGLLLVIGGKALCGVR